MKNTNMADMVAMTHEEMAERFGSWRQVDLLY